MEQKISTGPLKQALKRYILFFRDLTRRVWDHLEIVVVLYLIHGGDKIKYLRWRGVRIGENCSIYTDIDAFGSEPWLIEIRDNVTLTRGVTFITHDGSSRIFRSEIPGGSKFGDRFGRILIHDSCFIGVNSIIMPDVEIGPRSIVGAGSVVNKNVPTETVVAGVPARVICALSEYIEKYKMKMITINAQNRNQLRNELTSYFWGEER